MTTNTETVLMQDAFETLRPGPLVEVCDGAYREMHARPVHPEDNMGGWERRIGHWALPADKMFTLVESDDGRRLQSNTTATVYDNATLWKGDPDWEDVCIETTVELLELGENAGLPGDEPGWGGPVGVVFRFHSSMEHYAAVIDVDGYAKLLKRVENHWDVLAWKRGDFALHTPHQIRVTATGDRLRAEIGDLDLEAREGSITAGCVGFVGSRPARFGPITVTAVGDEANRLRHRRQETESRLAEKRKRYGAMTLRRTFDTQSFGTAKRLRFGDLTGDGTLDILLIQIHETHPYQIACLTALSGTSGEVLWQNGNPIQPLTKEVSFDGAAQIHDIDNDGRCEVVCAWNGKIQILDGASGRIKHEEQLPAPTPLGNLFKQSVHDWGSGYNDAGETMTPTTIYFADLAGRGYRGDIILNDFFHLTVALGPDLKELWRDVCAHGHFPQSYDFDGDGREDVLNGYHHLSPDGALLGRVCLTDHQDAIFVGPMDENASGPIRVIMAGGEDGLIRMTPQYDIVQRFMGHVQRLSIGKFRDDLPGLCLATVTFHGNNGIVSLFDAGLKRIWTRDFPVIGATLQPVNWDGTGSELMLLTAMRESQGYSGGLIDGDGDVVVPIPEDGGPCLCSYVLDIDGDGIDEIIAWDYDRIWIYGCDAAPRGSHAPIRPPLCNISNFQSYYSLPGGSPFTE